MLAVDEGILQVARYKNPDPLGYFFQKRMLEVDTTQILDLILPDFKRFMALAAPAAMPTAASRGTESVQHESASRRSRTGRASSTSAPTGRELTYTVPDYFNGTLRIVAVAASARRVGVAEVGDRGARATSS